MCFFFCVGVWSKFLASFVVTSAGDAVQSHGGGQIVIGKFTDDLMRFVALLVLDQFVSFQCDGALDLATVQRFLVELFAQLKLDAAALERGHRVVRVLVTVFLQVNGRADGVAHFAQHQTNAYK